jgi:hypothetical protein
LDRRGGHHDTGGGDRLRSRAQVRRSVSLPFLVLLAVVASCGPRTLSARLVYAERRAGEVETSLEKAEREMAELDPDAAERHLEDAKKGLLDPEIDYYPEHSLLRDRYKADAARLPAVRAEKDRRALEAKILAGRQALQQALAEFDQALAGLQKRELSSSEVSKVKDAQEEVEEALEEGRALERQSTVYAAEAQSAQLGLERASPRIRLANQTVEFIQGPGEQHQEATLLLREAKEEKDSQDRLERFVKARDAYRRCAETATQLLTGAPGLEKVGIAVEEHNTTPRAIASACADGAASAEKTLASLRTTLKKKGVRQASAKPAPKKRRR